MIDRYVGLCGKDGDGWMQNWNFCWVDYENTEKYTLKNRYGTQIWPQKGKLFTNYTKVVNILPIKGSIQRTILKGLQNFNLFRVSFWYNDTFMGKILTTFVVGVYYLFISVYQICVSGNINLESRVSIKLSLFSLLKY